MDLKQKLINLKEKLKNTSKNQNLEQDDKIKPILENINNFDEQPEIPSSKKETEHLKNKKTIALDDKVEKFIEWYYQNMVKGEYTDIGEYIEPIRMRNFIEKIAVWYELRYPNYEVNKIISNTIDYLNSPSDVIFKYNTYIEDIFDDNSLVKEIEWSNFYNTKAFINSLPSNERWYFENPKYPDFTYINNRYYAPQLHLTRNGFIEEAECMELIDSSLKNTNLKGKHIKEIFKILTEKGVEPSKIDVLADTIKTTDEYFSIKKYQKQEMLNCAMYRIIERGGNRIGAKRAFIFAKEFGLNIDIPMSYGVDVTDPHLRPFINKYLKAGGREDLNCYIGYHFKTTKYDKLETITIREILKRDNKYTEEEHELHQKLANYLYLGINQTEYNKEITKQQEEQTKQLRLQRKIEKSKHYGQS